MLCFSYQATPHLTLFFLFQNWRIKPYVKPGTQLASADWGNDGKTIVNILLKFLNELFIYYFQLKFNQNIIKYFEMSDNLVASINC